jgi:ketosteroid isomerase-like protein
MRLSTIRTLYGSAGPWASVYLDATLAHQTGTPQETRRELDLRWRAARESLGQDGADEATLRAIDEVVREAPAHGGPAEVAVFASGGTVAFSRNLPVTPRRQIAIWSAQPHAADLVRGVGAVASTAARDAPAALASLAELGDSDSGVRWVRADVDRTGGTVSSSDGAVVTVRGEDEFITKVSTIERARHIWSEPNFQRVAEENWDHNSRDVARVITAAVERTGADVIVLAGDIRARQLVIERLPAVLGPCVVEVDHELAPRPHPESRVQSRREPDVHDRLIDAATRSAVDSVVHDRDAETIDKFYNGLSRGDSVRGLDAVCAAARELRIDTLVLSAQPSPAGVWVDPLSPTTLGPAKRDASTTSSPVWEPADDALVGAAAIAAADSIVVETDVELVDGVGAILRYQP